MRSASAFFRPSRSPFGSKAVFGSAPAKSWSRMASGIWGSLRLGMVRLLSTHHARPTHEIPDSLAVAARVLGEVLLPQQDPRHPGLVELAMHHGPIRRGPPSPRPGGVVVRGVWINAGREQARL